MSTVRDRRSDATISGDDTAGTPEHNAAVREQVVPEPSACAECGHLHWFGSTLGYGPCPVDGCDCQGQPEGPVDPDGTVRDALGNFIGIDQPAAARRFRDHGEEIAAALDGTHPALQTGGQS